MKDAPAVTTSLQAPGQVVGQLPEGASLVERSRPCPERSDAALDADPCFLLYSHDAAGLGHVRRNLAVASALLARNPRAPVLVVASTEDVYRLGVPPGAEVLTLPAWRKLPDGRYEPRRLRVRVEVLRALRTGLLTAAVDRFRPTVLLTDKHPLGIDAELLPALEALRAAGGRAVLGLRDILDDPAVVRCEWQAARLPEHIDRYYDRVLVYGQPDILNPIAEYDLPGAVANRTHFCGYVVRSPVVPAREATCVELLRQRPVVLATAGGGEDGLQLLRTFVAASVGAPWHGIAVTGPMAPDGPRAALEAEAAEAGVLVRHFVSDLDGVFGAVDALVTMGGYNTLAEALVRGTPAVCVPRVRPRTEQAIRASRFAARGLLTHLAPHELGPDTLRQAVSDTLGRTRPACRTRAHQVLRFDGARRAAAHLLDVAGASGDLVPLEAMAG